jgi:hypothetical protein
VDMTASSQVVEVAERFFFGLNAKVEMMPVMALEDLEQGLSTIEKHWRRHSAARVQGGRGSRHRTGKSRADGNAGGSGFYLDDRRTSADVSDTPVGCFLGQRFWLCRKLKHGCLLVLA